MSMGYAGYNGPKNWVDTSNEMMDKFNATQATQALKPPKTDNAFSGIPKQGMSMYPITNFIRKELTKQAGIMNPILPAVGAGSGALYSLLLGNATNRNISRKERLKALLMNTGLGAGAGFGANMILDYGAKIPGSFAIGDTGSAQRRAIGKSLRKDLPENRTPKEAPKPEETPKPEPETK